MLQGENHSWKEGKRITNFVPEEDIVSDNMAIDLDTTVDISINTDLTMDIPMDNIDSPISIADTSLTGPIRRKVGSVKAHPYNLNLRGNLGQAGKLLVVYYILSHKYSMFTEEFCTLKALAVDPHYLDAVNSQSFYNIYLYLT